MRNRMPYNRSQRKRITSSIVLVMVLFSTGIHAVNAVKPEFVAEPKDKFFLPNSPAAFSCEAKFVSKLHFNCTGGLVPREVYNNQTGNHVTLLIVKILPVLIKTVASDVVCICVASGYNGQVITSRGATAKKACK